MLGNCEKMAEVISTTTTTSTSWPHHHHPQNLEDRSVMEKPNNHHDQQQQQQQQQSQQPLKCPRCDSTNTKFCYYNNYSLSQPRHFCKACKRYWTRGGTLRNVPVGGGCRKNKRVKKPSSLGSDAGNPSSSSPNPSIHPQIDLSNNHPLFYGLSGPNSSDLSLPFGNPRFNSRVSGVDMSGGGYDFQQHMGGSGSGLGLGFSSGNDVLGSSNFRNGSGFGSTKQIQDILPSYPIFGTSPSNPGSSLASLIASSLQQQKIMSSGFKDIQPGNIQGSLAFQGMQIQENGGEGGVPSKDMKLEEGHNVLNWNSSNQNQIEQIGSSSLPSSSWNPNGLNAWFDPSNMGSSVPSLI